MENTWREGLAGAGWFFNGEGHVGSSVGKTRKWVRRDLYLSLSQTDPWVLNKFREFVGGLGKVTGPFARTYRNPKEHDVYYYQLTRFEHIQAVIAMMWGWLSPIKKAQAKAALLAMRDRPTHQPVCKYGHPRTPENIYISGKYRHCKACRRKMWADRRERQRLLNPPPVRDPNVCGNGHVLTETGVYTYGDRTLCKRCAIDRATKNRELKRMAAALLEA